MSGSGTGIVTPYNTHRGLDLDGAADAYTRAADLVGNADGQQFTISGWFRIDGGDGTLRHILGNTNNRVRIELTAGNTLRFLGRTAAAAVAVQMTTSVTYLAGSGWHHAVWAGDLSVPAAQVYVDGAIPALGTNTVNAAIVDFTRNIWAFGSDIAPANFWNGALSEWYLNFAEYVAQTTAANRALFRHPNGQPPNILADGSGPTGNQPIGYFVEEGGVMVNRGSGGAFVTVGAPAVSADSPKDRWVASLIHGQRRRRSF